MHSFLWKIQNKGEYIYFLSTSNNQVSASQGLNVETWRPCEQLCQCCFNQSGLLGPHTLTARCEPKFSGKIKRFFGFLFGNNEQPDDIFFLFLFDSGFYLTVDDLCAGSGLDHKFNTAISALTLFTVVRLDSHLADFSHELILVLVSAFARSFGAYNYNEAIQKCREVYVPNDIFNLFFRSYSCELM